MSDLQSLSERVMQNFSRWSGFPRFTRMLAEFPRLDVCLAGGTIRNLLLDPEARIKDYDILVAGPGVRAAMDWLAQEGRSKRGVYGNLHWYPHAGEPLRADVIPVTNFDWCGPSATILDALNQFDFTGNAIAVDLRTGAVLNPQNGIRDLEQRIMRAIRFDVGEEPIRPGHPVLRSVCQWFRILHYAAALGLKIEPVTMRWLLAHSDYRAYRDVFTQEFKPPHPNALLVHDHSPDVRMAT
jgi:hypothetical protein